MKVKELLDIANEGYPDQWLEHYYDEDGEFVDDRTAGDSLARFIVIELTETFDPDADEADQLTNAVEKMEKARMDLLGVMDALMKFRFGKTH